MDKAAIALRLHAAAIHLLRTVRVEDRKLGLTPARLSVLSILVFGGAHTLTQLTAAEQVAPPTMTKLIAGLEREGYVARTPTREDGRSWSIHATAKARRLLQRGRDRRIEHLVQVLGGASTEEWHAIERAVAAIEKSLRDAVHGR